MSDSKKTSFFRQSAWMVLATVASGMAMMLVHNLVRKRDATAYVEFKTLLSSFYVIAAIGGGLWTLFAQQAAAAVTETQVRSVAAAARRVLFVTLALWLLAAVALAFRQDYLVSLWKLSNPAALWATWALGLLTLWASVLRGLVQGRQQFFELGWMAICDGFGRLTGVWIALTVFAALAAGVMTAAVVGVSLALVVGFQGARSVLLLKGGTVAWRPWLRGFVPLAMNAAALQLFQQYDQLFWPATVPADRLQEWNLASLYAPAQTIGFAITQFAVPLALVMLPRLARSVAMGEKTDSLKLTLLATLIMSGGAAVGCTLFPALPLQVMFFNKPETWQAAPLVPWFAWAMALFTLANVFLGDLFARRQWGIVWAVLGLAGGYILTLRALQSHFLSMMPTDSYRLGVQIIGLFNLALLVVAAGFSQWNRRRSTNDRA